MMMMHHLNLNILLLLVVLVFPHQEAVAQESCDECISFVKKLNKIDDTDECRTTCKRDQNKRKFTLEPKCGKKCCKNLCKGNKPQKSCEKQKYCVNCKNDPEFGLKGDPEKDCDFIAENPDVRCPKKGALEGCPEICNPVCAQPPSPTSAPTIPSPSASPSIDCTDDPEFRLKNDPEKDCAYIAEDTELRCDKKGVLEGCPATCNLECESTGIDPVCNEKINQCLPCVERGCFFKGGNSEGGCSDCLPYKGKCDVETGYCIGISFRERDLCIERLKEGCEQYL